MKEGREPTLEELYAPPTLDACAPSERPKKKWSVGLTMDLVFSILEIIGAILSVLSYPGLWEFFGQPVGLDTTFWVVGVPMTLLSVLITWMFPLVAVPIRIVTALVTAFRKTALRAEFMTFFGYLVVSGFSYLIVQHYSEWVFYIT